MIELLAAASLQLPSTNEWTARYLARALDFESAEQTAASRVALWVDKRGKVLECKMIAYVGEKALAEQMCAKVVGARLEPARDAAGEAQHAVFTTILGGSGGSVHRSGTMSNWLSGPSAQEGFLIELSKVPVGLGWNPKVELNLLVNVDGKVEECEFGILSDQQWAEVACDQSRLASFESRSSAKGDRVSYIRNLVVKFVEQQ